MLLNFNCAKLEIFKHAQWAGRFLWTRVYICSVQYNQHRVPDHISSELFNVALVITHS